VLLSLDLLQVKTPMTANTPISPPPEAMALTRLFPTSAA
jgi:hypothetical protein